MHASLGDTHNGSTVFGEKKDAPADKEKVEKKNNKESHVTRDYSQYILNKWLSTPFQNLTNLFFVYYEDEELNPNKEEYIFTAHLAQPEIFFPAVFEKFFQENSVVQKIKILKLLEHILTEDRYQEREYEMADDRDARVFNHFYTYGKRETEKFFENIASQKDLPYIISMYLRNISQGGSFIGDYHDQSLKDVFEFTEEDVKRMINYDASAPDAVENVMNDIGRHYIVTQMAEDVVSVFTNSGDVIGCVEQEKNTEKRIPLLKINAKENHMVDDDSASDGEDEYFTGGYSIKLKKIGELTEIKNTVPTQDQELFYVLSHLHFRKKIEEDLGVNISHVAIRTQLQLLNYLKNNNEEEVDHIRTILLHDKEDHEYVESILIKDDPFSGSRGRDTYHTSGEFQFHREKLNKNRLTAFLSLEHGDQDMGAKILRIAEKYDPETVDAIFAKYAEMVDVTDNIEDDLKTQFHQHTDINQGKIGEKLLVDAKDLLVAYADRDDVASKEEIMRAVNKINGRVVLTAEIIRALPRESVAHMDLTTHQRCGASH